LTPVSFASIGECMIELSAREGELWRLGFAGDTFNTAWYARAILPSEQGVSYVTALGDDPFSIQMRDFIAGAGVGADRIRIVAGRRPGLYAITLKGAERAFTYWRGESAARHLAEDAAWLDAALSEADLLYFSGVTLGILAPESRDRLFASLAKRRESGSRIAFDPNFRPALWPDAAEARGAMQRAYRASDIVLPSFEDEQKLFGDADPAATAARIAAAGAGEIVVKDGSEPCLIRVRERTERIAPSPPESVVDTTGAGDSFAGAYLAGRLLGMPPVEAARLGHAVAAEVIGVRGALAPIDREKVLRVAQAKREG
jgi:2-dehydro-3-deoxygluconokinase